LLFKSHLGSFASNLEQVANLLRAQDNSASYPQWGRKWVVAHSWRPTVADWGGGMSASCKPRDQPAVHWRGQWMAA